MPFLLEQGEESFLLQIRHLVNRKIDFFFKQTDNRYCYQLLDVVLVFYVIRRALSLCP